MKQKNKNHLRDIFHIWERFSVGEARESLRPNDRVDLFLRFLLDLWIQHHSKEKGRGDRNGLCHKLEHCARCTDFPYRIRAT